MNSFLPNRVRPLARLRYQGEPAVQAGLELLVLSDVVQPPCRRRTCERASRQRIYFKYWSNHSSQTRSRSDSCTGSLGSCPAVGMAMNFTVTPLSLSAWYIA